MRLEAGATGASDSTLLTACLPRQERLKKTLISFPTFSRIFIIRSVSLERYYLQQFTVIDTGDLGECGEDDE